MVVACPTVLDVAGAAVSVAVPALKPVGRLESSAQAPASRAAAKSVRRLLLRVVPELRGARYARRRSLRNDATRDVFARDVFARARVRLCSRREARIL